MRGTTASIRDIRMAHCASVKGEPFGLGGKGVARGANMATGPDGALMVGIERGVSYVVV
jgi:hypothetical protein